MEERIPYEGESIRHKEDGSGRLWRCAGYIPSHKFVQIQREKHGTVYGIPLKEVEFVETIKVRRKSGMRRQRVAVPDDFSW